MAALGHNTIPSWKPSFNVHIFSFFEFKLRTCSFFIEDIFILFLFYDANTDQLP